MTDDDAWMAYNCLLDMPHRAQTNASGNITISSPLSTLDKLSSSAVLSRLKTAAKDCKLLTFIILKCASTLLPLAAVRAATLPVRRSSCNVVLFRLTFADEICGTDYMTRLWPECNCPASQSGATPVR